MRPSDTEKIVSSSTVYDTWCEDLGPCQRYYPLRVRQEHASRGAHLAHNLATNIPLPPSSSRVQSSRLPPKICNEQLARARRLLFQDRFVPLLGHDNTRTPIH